MEAKVNQLMRWATTVGYVLVGLIFVAIAITVVMIVAFQQAERGLTGADGAQGIQGPKGDKGDKGDRGAPGQSVVVSTKLGLGCMQMPERPLKVGARYALEYRGVDRGCVIYRLSPIFGRDP